MSTRQCPEYIVREADSGAVRPGAPAPESWRRVLIQAAHIFTLSVELDAVRCRLLRLLCRLLLCRCSTAVAAAWAWAPRGTVAARGAAARVVAPRGRRHRQRARRGRRREVAGWGRVLCCGCMIDLQ